MNIGSRALWLLRRLGSVRMFRTILFRLRGFPMYVWTETQTQVNSAEGACVSTSMTAGAETLQ